jgi:hypothetical protein
MDGGHWPWLKEDDVDDVLVVAEPDASGVSESTYTRGHF